jgi:hypothetical protein
MLLLNTALRSVSNNTFRHSTTHGVAIQSNGTVRAFDDNTFEEN